MMFPTATILLLLFLHHAPSIVVHALASTKPSSSTSKRSQRRPAEDTDTAHTRRQESRSVGRDPLLSLNLNLDALARSKAPEQAQELFHRITALHQAGYYDVQPDTVSFNSVLKAWTNVAEPAKALEFWESTTASSSETTTTSSSTITKNIRSYNAFVLALASVGMYQAASQLLTQMLWVNAAVRPDRITYNIVLLAHSRAHHRHPSKPEIAERAEEILYQMMNGTTTATITDTSPQQQPSSSKTKFRMVQIPPVIDPHYVPPRPDATTFNIVISCIQQHCSGENAVAAAQRAEAWLRYMADHCTDDDNDNTIPAPDAYTYTAVTKAWKSVPTNDDRAIDHALQLLAEAEQTGICRHNSREHIILVTLVVQILCQHGQPARAERLLLESISRPDVTAYTSLMQGWVNAYYTQQSSSIESQKEANVAALHAALRIWKHMQQGGGHGAVVPTAQTYTVLLQAASRVDGAWAERILHHMPTPVRSVLHTNTVLDGYARANDVGGAERLWEATKIMDGSMAPDIVTYNIVLRAADRRVGLRVLQALRDDPTVTPTPATFQALFKFVRRRLGSSSQEERWERLDEMVRWCSALDCWNERVTQQLRRCQLTDIQQESLRDVLPDTW